MSRFSAIPDECEECPLPDCYPTDARCPVLRRKASSQGLTLPEVPLDAPVGKRGPKRRLESNVAPSSYEDKQDYHRQYSREYNLQFRKILIRGIKVRRGDIALLRSVCEAGGRSLEGELIALIDAMAEQARASLNK